MIKLLTLGTVDVRGSDDAPLDAALSGPKRLALFTYLALARPHGFQRRDSILPLLWPDSDQQHARGALRNLLYQTRSAVGKGVIVSRGSEEIGIREGALWCDAVAFEDALDRWQLREALDLYRGDLLEGFHVPDGDSAFEHWLYRERERIRRRAAEAAWALAEQAEAEANPSEAARYSRKAVSLSRWDEAALHRFLRLLERVEGPTGALQAYEDHARRLRAEWQEEPSEETQALAEELREHRMARTSMASRRDTVAQEEGEKDERSQDRVRLARDVHTAPLADARQRKLSSRFLTSRNMIVLGAAILAAVVIALVRFPALHTAHTVVAVGRIEMLAGADTADFAPALRNLIVANLAESTDIQVIGVERLHEVLAPADPGERPRGAWIEAARRAGAEVLIEGVLHARPGGQYQLSLTRQDLASGRMADAVTASGMDLYALTEQVTSRILASLGIEVAPLRATDATTRSLAAYRFYEEGLRAYYAGDGDAAHRLFAAALAEDSLFAMAVYYRALSREEIDHQAFRRDLGHAARLAARASDRERLLIRSAWAQEMDEPRQLALAETLAIRYPHEPDGHLFLGKAQLWSGGFGAALPHLRTVIRMDSLSLSGNAVRCRACDAMQDIVTAYLLRDSLQQAEVAAQQWVRERPGSAGAWQYLARVLEYQGRNEKALEARNRAVALRADNPRDVVYPAVLALRAGEFARADSILAALRRPGASLVQQNVLWYQTLSLREQGFFDEALGVARAYRDMVLRAETPAQRRPWESVLEAVVLQETGRPHEAARIWRAMAEYPYEPESPPRTARHRAWTLTHMASALAAARDTVQLSALADTIEQLGARSAYGRDPRLHHHVRGLLWLARGDTAQATHAFRSAIFSPTAGYGRANVELGRSLLARDQPEAAARILGAALRGPLDAGNLYASRAEIHRLLARALRSAGQTDSARVHERLIIRAQSR